MNHVVRILQSLLSDEDINKITLIKDDNTNKVEIYENDGVYTGRHLFNVPEPNNNVFDYVNDQKIHYDEDGQQIYLEDSEGGLTLLVDVRGWGHISNISKTEKEAITLQDSIGKFVTEAIKEKLERDKPFEKVS